MRRWRSPQGTVAELDAGRYALLGADGSVQRVYEPYQSSDEDDLWHFRYRVAEGALRCGATIERPRTTQQRDYVEVDGLQELGDDDAPSPRQVEAAMAARAAQASEQEAAIERKIDASVRGFVVPPALATARRRLAERVARWGDPVSAALLLVLEEVSRMDPTPAVAKAVPALDAACRHATFTPCAWTAPDAPEASWDALPPTFAAARDALLGAAESQDWCDAPANATCYRKAEKALRQAAALLAPVR